MKKKALLLDTKQGRKWIRELAVLNAIIIPRHIIVISMYS